MPAFRRRLLKETDRGPIYSEVAWNGYRNAYETARRTWSHVIANGETLSGICQQRDTDPAQVMRQNGIVDPDKIVVGRVLTYDSAKDVESARLAAAPPGAVR